MPENIVRHLTEPIVYVPLILGLAAATQALSQPIAPEVADLYTLVQNGGFEDGDKLPAFWARYPPEEEQGARHLRDTTVSHSGQASGLVDSFAPHPPGKAGPQWNRYNLAVEGGSTLIASFWVRTEGVSPAGGGAHFYDERGGHLGFVRIRAPGTGEDWTYVRQEVPVPDGTVKMGYALYARDEGKTWFDDVALLGTPNTTAHRATPKLDGKLDDACWADDRAIVDFAVHTGDKLPTEKIRAWLAYDDSNLYVAFHCPRPEGATLRAEAIEHDGKAWLDDSIEVFLDPWHNHDNYYQFSVNCRGVIRDQRRFDTTWESGARAEVERGETAWTVELAIPFDNLALNLDVSATWGLNLVRNDRVRGETATWSLGGFHKPGRFGNMGLDPDLSRFLAADLARVADAKERARQSLLQELQEADLPQADEAQALIAKAKAEIDRLRAITRREAAPEGGWDSVRQSVAGIGETLVAARAAAVNALFQAQDASGASVRVVIAHSLQKVPRSGAVTQGVIAREVRLEAAQDEAESFQLVVVPSGQGLAAVTVEAEPLTGPGGELPLAWHRVGYVETAEPKYPTEYVGWWPDPLLPPGPFDVQSDERQPLWFTVSVPPDATPGVYEGQVTVRHGEASIAVPVELRVRNFRLPRPGTLATAFGLYAPFLARWWWGKQSYRDNMPLDMYARWCEFMGRYRLAPKNFAREYVVREKTEDGMKVDMSALQQTVGALAAKYFAPYSFCVHRVTTAQQLRGKEQQRDPTADAAIVRAHADEWKRQGFPSEVYIYGYDEPNPSQYAWLREAYTAIREAVPEYPIMQTLGGTSPEELAGVVDIWCPLTAALPSEFYAKRKAAGDTLWTYVCCGPLPPHANFFVDQPATDHRMVFWQARQHGATGVLYWGICIWDGLPMPHSGEKCFPEAPIRLKDHCTYKSFQVNGDGLLVYPGPGKTPYPSMRLEMIRDGIEDYEYLALLSRLVERAKALPPADRPDEDTLRAAEELCRVPETISRTMTDYTKDPQDLFDRRREVADMIERLTALIP